MERIRIVFCSVFYANYFDISMNVRSESNPTNVKTHSGEKFEERSSLGTWNSSSDCGEGVD